MIPTESPKKKKKITAWLLAVQAFILLPETDNLK